MKETKQIITTDKIKKIEFFDVLIEDIHSGSGRDHHCIENSCKLTYHEVWEWISTGGDWSFIVTEHDNPENIFMRGSSYQDMDSARKGETQVSITHATEAEISDIIKVIRTKRNKEYDIK